MAQPITWQNINAPQIDTSRGMSVAGSLFNHGFDKIGEVLKQQEAVGNANWDNTKLNNTNAYMEALASAKTPEELLAKQDLLAQLRQSAGAQMDMPAVLKATDLRAPELQQRAVAENTFKNTMQDAAEDPLKRQALAAKLRGDDATYSRIIAENPNARFVLDAVDKGRTWDHQNKTWDNEATTFKNQQTEFDHKQELWPGAKEAQRIQNENAVLAGKLTAAQVKETEADAASAGGKSLKKMAFEEQQATKIYAAAKANSEYGSGYLGSSEGDKAFLEAGMKMKLEDKDRASISEAKARLEKKLGIPIPVSIANEALYYSADTSWFGSSNRGKAFETAVLAKMGSPEQLQKYADEFKKYSDLTSNYQATIAGINGTTTTPSGVSGSATQVTGTPSKPGTPAVTSPTSDGGSSSWSLSKPPAQNPYANAGFSAVAPSEVPFGDSIINAAKIPLSILDILNGKKNIEAVGV